MNEAARLLRHARARAGLTQRALAARAGVPQPYVARVESSRTDPGVSSLARLLRACGATLAVLPGTAGTDAMEPVRALLALPPAERLARAAGDAAVYALRARDGAFVVTGAAAAALHGAPVPVPEVTVATEDDPDYAALARAAVRVDLGGRTVLVAALDDLVATGDEHLATLLAVRAETAAGP
ncbi:MAG TPA: helix-turn-helix transcriptional regulator [Frankiaceae bacterium]|nr:helix-turn-helix transcriptional regulator [Frankiaceae bacterium]